MVDNALERRFRRIARQLSDDLLGADDHTLIDGLGSSAERLLGFYSQVGVEHALEAYGVFNTLRARGYRHFEVRFELDDFTHGLRVYGDGALLCDCRLRQARGASDPCIAVFQRDFEPELLVVEWLSLADPRAQFTAKRPQLPGQTHPGSGVAAEVFTLLTVSARRLGLHGVLEVPERLHNALLYGRRAHFIDPLMEGRFLALAELARQHSLAELAWAMEAGRIIDTRTDTPVVWAPREQLHPLDGRLWSYFDLPAWRDTSEHERHALSGKLRVDAPAAR